MDKAKENYNFQKIVASIGLALFVIKFIAWYITDSVAILTDALESSVNIVTGFLGLYSLYLSAKPRDFNHPYGHGKVEFISAAVEGVLIIFAGIIIIVEAIIHLRSPAILAQLDFGIYLIAFTAIINYWIGYLAVKKGKNNHSLALVASGKHLQTDSYSTLGLILGLIILLFTEYQWLDSAIALVFALIITVTGLKILRNSIAGIMDEADKKLLEKMVNVLNQKRQPDWIDLHNVRIIKYGSTLHLDGHLTVPWYYNVHQAHDVIDTLDKIVSDYCGQSIELFVHTDGCLDFSCKLCTVKKCNARQHNFVKRIEWDVVNISSNERHKIELY